MTGPTPRAWSVTLSFTPPGPLHTTLIIAPDRDAALVAATLMLTQDMPAETSLCGVIASEVPAETLRQMLRAVEGRLPESGSAEVMRLVPEQPMACPPEAHEWDGDHCTRCGAYLTRYLRQRARVIPGIKNNYGPVKTPPPDDGDPRPETDQAFMRAADRVPLREHPINCSCPHCSPAAA